MKKLFGIFVLLTGWIAVLSSNGRLGHAQGNNPEPGPEHISYLDYVPKPSSFQPVLQPVASLLEEGVGFERAKQKKQALEKFQAAVELAERLLRQTSRGYHDELLLLLGFAYDKLGRMEQAIQAYKQSLELRSNNPLVLFRHAYALRRKGLCAQAVPELREFLWRTKDGSHEALFVIAECLLETGQEEEGLKLSQEAYQNNPLFLPVLRQLVTLREKQITKTSDPAEKARLENSLIADLNSIVKQAPDDREASLKLARLLIKQGDPLLSNELLKQAESLSLRFAQESKYTDELGVRTLFDAQIRQGALVEAEKTIDMALSAVPDSVVYKTAKKQLEIQQGVEKNDDQ